MTPPENTARHLALALGAFGGPLYTRQALCIYSRYNQKEVAALGTFIDHQRLYMRAPEVGNRVRQVREKLRLTQGEFARRLGVTRVSVARYEAGRVPSFGALHQLARLGGVTVGWLLQDTPEEEIASRLLTFLKRPPPSSLFLSEKRPRLLRCRRISERN